MLYRDLKVWQKGYDFALRGARLSAPARVGSARRVIFDQMIRSATSICASIAEGYGSESNAEFGRYLGIACKSALETDNWLQLLKGLDGPGATELDGIEQQNLETTKMLMALRKRVRDAPARRRY